MKPDQKGNFGVLAIFTVILLVALTGASVYFWQNYEKEKALKTVEVKTEEKTEEKTETTLVSFSFTVKALIMQAMQVIPAKNISDCIKSVWAMIVACTVTLMKTAASKNLPAYQMMPFLDTSFGPVFIEGTVICDVLIPFKIFISLRAPFLKIFKV